MADTDTTSDASPVGIGEHTHIGVQAHLRRVLTFDRKLVDGKTGEILNG